MGEVVAGYASSHAFTFVEPDGWESFRTKNRESYARRYGELPSASPGVFDESLESAAARYADIKRGLDHLRQRVRDDRLDSLIIIGDDQNENFDGSALPQIAVHTGPGFTLDERYSPQLAQWSSTSELASDLVVHAVEADFDVTGVQHFRGDTLQSHAHAQIVENILRDFPIPVVLVFLNAIHVPALSPRRCFEFGRTIADAVRTRRPADERVGVYASGGLSHFTAGYPWRAYTGPHVHGSIDEKFDRRTVELLESGRADELAELTTSDLLETGNIELRAWICTVGAVGGTTPWSTVYQPLLRAIMGMAVAWTPEPRAAR
jgi:hypothetical protein